MINKHRIRNAWRRLQPGRETVTLKIRQAGEDQGTFLSYTLPRARLKPLTRAEVSLYGGVLAAHRYRKISIWQESLDNATAVAPASLPCPVPKVGDVVTGADGTNWVIFEVTSKLLLQIHECVCEQEVT